MPKREVKTERLGIRVSPTEKATLERAAELLGDVDTAELVRQSSLMFANTIMQLSSGEMSLPVALSKYVSLLLRFVELPEITEIVRGRDKKDFPTDGLFSIDPKTGKVDYLGKGE